MNLGNVITEIPATQSACPSVCAVCSKWDVLKKEKTNCGNTIVEIREEKKIFVAIVAMHCRNRGRKKNNDYRNLGRN